MFFCHQPTPISKLLLAFLRSKCQVIWDKKELLQVHGSLEQTNCLGEMMKGFERALPSHMGIMHACISMVCTFVNVFLTPDFHVLTYLPVQRYVCNEMSLSEKI